MTSLDPKFWCCIIRRFGSLGGCSWSSLAAGIAVRRHQQNFFVTEVSLQTELPNCLIVRCFIYHHNALHQLLYLLSTSYNKSSILPFESCDWIRAYQYLSVQHEPYTSFPQEPAARSTPAYLTSTITLGIQHIWCHNHSNCLMFFWQCIMNWLHNNYQLDALTIIYS